MRGRGWSILACILLMQEAMGDEPPSPEESRAAIRLADPALAVELAASEPAVASPVAMAWDEHGRLFVVEMTDYPNATTGGRIKRLEDRDGDGRYEAATVFAEGLHFPSGLAPWKGGWLVTSAPDLLYFKDHDGDSRADERKVILTGFHEGNQQLRVNSPTWGMDNWLYLANGRSGGAIRKPADPPERAVPLPRNDLRVRPDTGEFQPIAGFSQFGLPRDDWGDRFPSWNTVPIRHVVLEDTAGDRTVAEVLDLSDGGRIFSLAPAQRRFNAESVAFFNATCGPTIYRGQTLGPDYAGHVFLCEPLASVVHHRRLDPDGVTFAAVRVKAEKDGEFLASAHPWFRPVNLATGPDGALYVADFCREWVEHPDFVPKPLRDSVDFRVGHERGRLWRIVRKDRPRPGKPAWPGDAKPSELVSLLSHPDGWWRDTAQRLLVELRDPSTFDSLKRVVNEANPLASAHALWTLEGLGALDRATLLAGFHNAHPRVREQSARIAAGRPGEFRQEIATLADDPDARVRLRVVTALRGQGQFEVLARIAARDADSPWIVAALLSGRDDQALPLLDAMLRREPSWLGNLSVAQGAFLARLARIIGSRNRDEEMIKVLELSATTKGDPAGFALIQGLAEGQERQPHAKIHWNEASTGPWKPALEQVVPLRTRATQTADNASAPVVDRVRALAVVLATNPTAARPLVLSLIEPDQSSELQAEAARGFGRIADASLAESVLARWDQRALATRQRLLSALTTTVPLASKLAEAIEEGNVSATEIDPATREALARLNDPALQRRFGAIWKTAPVADRGAIVHRYQQSLALKADPVQGRALFVKNCQTCHARGAPGPKVGPDLMSVAGRPPDALLVAILDPSREAAPDGLGFVASTTRGQTFTGLLAGETASEIRLRRAGGEEDVIPRADLEALRPTGRSLMPDGLEQVLNPQDLADLIAFLRKPTP
jgi:putative membrane-bound dehydrogenase-like protein